MEELCSASAFVAIVKLRLRADSMPSTRVTVTGPVTGPMTEGHNLAARLSFAFLEVAGGEVQGDEA